MEQLIYGVPCERVKELCEADKDGRCVNLPCKVEDTVYRIGYDCEHCSQYVKGQYVDLYTCGSRSDCRIWDEGHCTSRRIAPFAPLCDDMYKIIPEIFTLGYYAEHKKEFGKTVFLTREAAETALKTMK